MIYQKQKKIADHYFLFDLCYANSRKIIKSLEKGRNEASKIISQKFGSPIKDADAYNADIAKLREIKYSFNGEDFDILSDDNLSELYLNMAYESSNKLEKYFDVKVDLDEDEVYRLKKISELYRRKPINITDELIDWTHTKG